MARATRWLDSKFLCRSMRFTISETGSVVPVDVISSISPYWDELWTTAANGWEFDVCMREGKPRRAVKKVSFSMTLAE